MKLQKRDWARPLNTITVFMIPLITYLILKFSGHKMHKEWLWWITIPILIIIWLLINFKFVRNKD